MGLLIILCLICIMWSVISLLFENSSLSYWREAREKNESVKNSFMCAVAGEDFSTSRCVFSFLACTLIFFAVIPKIAVSYYDSYKLTQVNVIAESIKRGDRSLSDTEYKQQLMEMQLTARQVYDSCCAYPLLTYHSKKRTKAIADKMDSILSGK